MFEYEPFLQILLATLLGSLIGLERRSRRKEAGPRTFGLVTMGCCLFAVIDIKFMQGLGSPAIGVVQAVAIGMGFLGSGIIIQNKGQVEGLTTAAAFWVASAIGIGVGMGFYSLSIAGTLLMILILSSFDWLERAEDKIFGKHSKHEDE
ncbi:MAG: MgtC/SapB family protein [Candidatus Gribaldobacteria bacterium]|nr:MgtC/SapB family protein [Candidatus Gribaldobacteria bacterium]